MQRILSLGTLAVIGWLAYTFLQGGSLQQIAGGAANQSNSQQFPNTQYRSPGNWNAPATSPASTGSNGAIQPPGQPNSGPVIRIASFNVQSLGNTKAAKQYVMVRLADIIRKFDLIAIQEIRSTNDYLIPDFLQLINNPGGNLPQRRYDYVIGQRVGRTTNQEQFLYRIRYRANRSRPPERLHNQRPRRPAVRRTSGGHLQHTRRKPRRGLYVHRGEQPHRPRPSKRRTRCPSRGLSRGTTLRPAGGRCDPGRRFSRRRPSPFAPGPNARHLPHDCRRVDQHTARQSIRQPHPPPTLDHRIHGPLGRLRRDAQLQPHRTTGAGNL